MRYKLRVRGEHPASYAALQPFRLGDLLRIADRPGTGGSGNEDWATVSAVSYSDEEIIIDLAAPLTHAYEIDATRVTSVWAGGAVGGLRERMGGDERGRELRRVGAGRVAVHNKGAIVEAWQLVFTSPTLFYGIRPGNRHCAGGRGDHRADYRPLNPATGMPYFTLQAAGWQGSFEAGDTVSSRRPRRH